MPSAADAVPSWVWVPELAAPDARLELDDDAAHHVRRVCRARPGDHLTLTDGRGGVARARLEDVRPATVRIEQLELHERPPATSLWCGAPEGDRADWLIEKLAELDVASFQPIDTARTRWDIAPRRTQRWARLARAALQQSCGAWLLDVRPSVALEVALGEHPDATRAWLADAAGDRRSASPFNGPWVGIVGPSNGFTDRERDSMVARGCELISLGPRRLRTETAALALAVSWTMTPGRA